MATAAELEQQYQAIRGGRESYSDIQARLAGELGIADRRKQLENVSKAILDTERLLETVPTAVQLRARQLGGPMTAAQTTRMTSAQSQPFTKQLGELSRTEQSAQVGMNELNTELLRRLGLISQERGEDTADWTRRIAQAQSAEEAARQERLAQAQINASRQAFADPNAIVAEYLRNMGFGGGTLGGTARVGGGLWGATPTPRRSTSSTKAFATKPVSRVAGGGGGGSGW